MTDKIILLVDDNENDVFLAQRALKKSNIANEVVVASDGQEALDYLFGNGKYTGRDLTQMPVVILLDLRMPKVDGFQVLRQIRANPQTKLLAVVCLTSSKLEIDIIKGYSEGCNAYVTKPVDFDQFAEAVKQLGLFWLVLNEPPPKIG
jgi:Response regulators consisting of a CheY-like receiver domain and a winged-helix DNA-binding domain